MNDAIERALKTWYPKDNPLHFDPLHPAIKLAGEAGELLDLYGKHKFKPGFNWWNCKHCQKTSEYDCQCDKKTLWYTPLVLDELGDWWYYCRILAYQQNMNISEWIRPNDDVPYDTLMFLSEMNYHSAKLLRIYESGQFISTEELRIAFSWFQDILIILDVTLDEITELNYRKLISDETNHGWANGA